MLEGAFGKIARAKKHLDEFAHARIAFMQTNPYHLTADEDPKTGDGHIWVTLDRDPDVGIGLTIGDAVHNLRSAFDHLACRLVGHEGSQISFPICNSRNEFDKRIGQSLPRVSVDTWASVERLQPYHAGEAYEADPLRTLQRLDNRDKHRAILVAAGGVKDSDVRIYRNKVLIVTARGRNPDAAVIVPNKKTFLYGVSLPQEWGGAAVDVESETALEIVFGEDEAFRGEAVDKVLAKLIEFTEETLKRFRLDFFPS